MLGKIALRNILRNRRRSLMTILAVAVGGSSIVLFGEFVGFILEGIETNTVQKVGHLTVFRTGYFDYGSGNPAAYGIERYREVMELIGKDPQIEPRLEVITPVVSLSGIAGNFDLDASKTFLGTGVEPIAYQKMKGWDEHLVSRRRVLPESGLAAQDESQGVVGVGLARVLGLCGPLHLENCPPRPEIEPARREPPPELPDTGDAPVSGEAGPRLDLLAATTAGAPNVVSFHPSRAESQGVRELDENLIVMNIGLAQKLLYGRGEAKATGIVLQLKRTEDLRLVRARLNALFAAHHLDLEVRDFAELQPFYRQAVGMFSAILLFIALVMGVIVVFTIANTMGMSVMERTSEIGTVRALGSRRGGVRRLFLIEGALLGLFGATAGVGAGQLVALIFNHSGAMWTPPGQAAPIPLEVLTSGVGGLLFVAWLLLIAIATFASLIPANRAARLNIVDALRHV